jgi:flagellar biosynthesis protein
MDIDLDQEIPANLYLVVAELLAWLYQIEAAIPPSLKTNNK